MTQMTNRVDLADMAAGPRQGQGADAPDQDLHEGDLATLVRRWMAAGTRVQERVRRESTLHIAPDPVDEAADADEAAEVAEISEAAEAGPAEPARADEQDAPDAQEQGDVTVESLVDPWGVPGGEGEPEAAPDQRPEAAPASDVVGDVAVPGAVPAVPRLPQRPTGPEVEQAQRVAVLIDARRVSADAAAGLLGLLAARGSVNVCRAYADWSRAELGDWVGRMRREGLHSFHHFPDDDEQALVAMAIDAVDIARDASVDEVVLAGDLTSALPLVHRLHAAGVRVVAVGAGHTPHDVRAACDEFVDTATLDGARVPVAGRHRA